MKKILQSPWFSIFFNPKKTFEELKTSPLKGLTLFIFIFILGSERILYMWYMNNSFDLSLTFIIFVTVIFGPLLGYIGLVISSFIMEKFGRLFKGKASYESMKIVYGWSAVPLIFVLLIWVLELFLFGTSLFDENFYNILIKEDSVIIFIILSIFETLFYCWSSFIVAIGFVKFHQFKKAKYVFYSLFVIHSVLLIFLAGIISIDLLSAKQNNEQVAKEDYDELLEPSDENFKIVPGNIERYNTKAYLLISEGNYAQGLEIIDSILQVDPDNDTALNNKGWALNSLGRYEEAEIVLKKALMEQPNDGIDNLNLANTYYWLGEYVKALDNYDIAISSSYYLPDVAPAFYGKALIHLEFGEYTQSIMAFHDYLELIPEDLDAYWGLVNAYDYSGQFEKALDTLDQIIRIDPNDVYAYTYNADMYLYEEDYETALSNYELTIKKFPESPDGYYGKSIVLVHQGKPNKAIEFLKEAISKDPYYADYALNSTYFDPIRHMDVFQNLVSN